MQARWGSLKLIGPSGEQQLPDEWAGLPSEKILDLKGKGFTKLSAILSCDEASKASDVGAKVRFFAFKNEPDKRHLVKVIGEQPARQNWSGLASSQLIDRVYQYAFSRKPNSTEAKVAEAIATQNGKPSPDGLEDLLWSLFVSPEFQYIR